MKRVRYLSFLLIICLVAHLGCAAPGMAEANEAQAFFDFRTSGGSSYVTGYRGPSGGMAEIEVPAALGGLPVRGIDAGALQRAKGVGAIKLPPDLDRIDLDAFRGVGDSVLRMRGDSATSRSVGMTGHHLVDLVWEQDEWVKEEAPPPEMGSSYPFAYEVLPDQTLKITGYEADFDGDVELVVPSEINGRPVRVIGTGAFTNVTKGYSAAEDYVEFNAHITLSEGIREIEEGAIVYSAGVSVPNLTLPASLERIAAGGIKAGFDGVSVQIHPDNPNFRCGEVNGDGCLVDLRDGWLLAYLGDQANIFDGIRVPDGVRHIPADAFDAVDGVAAHEMILPEGLLSIGDRAFSGLGLTELKLPDTLRSLGASVIYDTGIASLTLPRSLEVIQGHPSVDENGGARFRDGEGNVSSRLAAIQIDENNPYLTIRDNAVFDQQGALLFHLAPDTLQSYSVPAGTKVLASRALTAARQLTEITLPEGLRAVGNNALPVNGQPITVNRPQSLSFFGHHPQPYSMAGGQQGTAEQAPAAQESFSVEVEQSGDVIVLGQSIHVDVDIRGDTAHGAIGYECILYAFDAKASSHPVFYRWEDDAGTEFSVTPDAAGIGMLEVFTDGPDGRQVIGYIGIEAFEKGDLPAALPAPPTGGITATVRVNLGAARQEAAKAVPAPLPTAIPAARLFPPEINNLMNGGAFVRDSQRFYAQHTGPRESYHLYQVTPDFQVGSAAMDRQRTDARYTIFENRLYFYSVSEKKPGLYAFDMVNGAVAGDGVKVAPQHAMVYAVDPNGVYYAVKGSKGIWRVDHQGGGKVKLANHEVNAGNNILRMLAYGDMLYYVNAADAQLYAVPTDGSAPARRVGSEPMHYFILAEYQGKPIFVFVTYGKNRKQLEQSTLRAMTMEGGLIEGLFGLWDVRTRYINYLDGWLYYTDTAEEGVLKRLRLDDPAHRETVLYEKVAYIHAFDGWVAVLPLNGEHYRYFIDTRCLSVHMLPAL